MSRSIKQYKDAMDSVRISESFYARTETLLKENSSSERITAAKPSYGRKCIGLVLGAAACAAIFTAVGKDKVTDDAVTSGAVEETVAVTEVTAASETIYIDIEEDHVIYTISPSAEPDVTQAPKEIAERTTAHEVTSCTNESAVNAPDSAAGETGVAVETEEIVEEAVTAAEPDIMGLYSIDFSSSETELTSYLNSGFSAESDGGYTEEGDYVEEPAPSGLNFIVLDEFSAAEVVEMVADAVDKTETAPVKDIRRAEFVIRINNEETGEVNYTIAVNDDGVITVAEGDTAVRNYTVNEEKFLRIEKVLFLKFGSVAQYEDFING